MSARIAAAVRDDPPAIRPRAIEDPLVCQFPLLERARNGHTDRLSEDRLDVRSYAVAQAVRRLANLEKILGADHSVWQAQSD